MRRAAAISLALVACSAEHVAMTGDDDRPDAPGSTVTSSDGAIDVPHRIQTVFVIPLENKADVEIYSNTTDAPYINSLLPHANHASQFKDALPDLPSEPHYLWMEGGTNAFTDHTFTNDNDASASNSTASPNHLVAQLETAGIAWMSYQEGITAGTCPIASTGHYAAKHNPFAFFKDVVGSPPSAANAYCAAHHKPYSAFAADLAAGLTGYIFITPDLCHDMHGASGCPSGESSAPNIKAGDTWLSQELPRIIDYANTHDAVIFLTWDEGSSTNLIPFIALGSRVQPGISSKLYTHSSLLKTTEEILGVPVLPRVSSANDLREMFEPGAF